jgi:RNA polymerase sigma-70 factor (ECF subfamily)
MERLVRRYLRPVQAVTASFLAERADVEDAVQETFLKALAGIGGYRPERPFAPWLYQIARNTARSRLVTSHRQRGGSVVPSELEEPAAGPEVNFERVEIRRLVDAALDELPEQRRLAFRLHDVEGYETSEVARIMGLSAGTVRSHVHHARRALRAALAGKLDGPGSTGEEVDASMVE